MAITSKVIDGRYNFDQNVLELDIETTTPGVDGADPIVERKRRKFDVTSLTVTKASHGDQPSRDIEVLGARTQAAMDDIMPKIIANFKAMSDCESLIGRVTDRTQTSSVKFEMNRDMDSTATEAAMRADPRAGYVMKDVSGKVTGSASDLTTGADGQYSLAQFAQSESIIQNPQVVSQLLKASSWESMIRDVEGDSAKTSNHEWKSSKPLKATTQQLDDVLRVFSQTRGIAEGLTIDRLGDACVRLHGELEPALDELEQRILDVEQKISAAKDYIAAHDDAPGEQNLSEVQIGRIQDKIAYYLALKQELVNRIDRIENEIPVLLKELAIMMSIKNLKEQKLMNMGVAPMGTVLTEEWDDLVSKFELLPPTGYRDLGGLERHLEYKLGLSMDPRFGIPTVADLNTADDTLFERINLELGRSSGTTDAEESDAEESDATVGSDVLTTASVVFADGTRRQVRMRRSQRDALHAERRSPLGTPPLRRRSVSSLRSDAEVSSLRSDAEVSSFLSAESGSDFSGGEDEGTRVRARPIPRQTLLEVPVVESSDSAPEGVLDSRVGNLVGFTLGIQALSSESEESDREVAPVRPLSSLEQQTAAEKALARRLAKEAQAVRGSRSHLTTKDKAHLSAPVFDMSPEALERARTAAVKEQAEAREIGDLPFVPPVFDERLAELQKGVKRPEALDILSDTRSIEDEEMPASRAVSPAADRLVAEVTSGLTTAQRLGAAAEDRLQEDEQIRAVLRVAIEDGDEEIIARLKKLPDYARLYNEVAVELSTPAAV